LLRAINGTKTFIEELLLHLTLRGRGDPQSNGILLNVEEFPSAIRNRDEDESNDECYERTGGGCIPEAVEEPAEESVQWVLSRMESLVV
jgi:hypothetical protein